MINIFVDGCRKKVGDGGYGYLIFHDGKMVIGGGHKQNTTNNVMELLAPIMAMTCLHLDFRGTTESIEITSDSKYFVDGFNSWMAKWQANGWCKSGGDIKNLTLWQSLFQFSKTYRIKAKWVKGHNGHKENELCDIIANKCCLSRCYIKGTIPDTGRMLGAYSLSAFVVPDKFGKTTRHDGNDETFLRMMEDGTIVVRDGRGLDEYLNHPSQIEKRKLLNLGEVEVCIVTKEFFNRNKSLL